MSWYPSFLFIASSIISFLSLFIVDVFIGFKLQKERFFFIRVVASLLLSISLITLFALMCVFVLNTQQVKFNSEITCLTRITSDVIALLLSLSVIQACFVCDIGSTILIALIGFSTKHLILSLFAVFALILSGSNTSINFEELSTNFDYQTISIILALYILFFIITLGIIVFILRKKQLANISYYNEKSTTFTFIFIVSVDIVSSNITAIYINSSNFLIGAISFAVQATLSVVVLLLQFYLISHFQEKIQREEDAKHLALVEKNYHFTKSIIEDMNIKAHDLKHQIRLLENTDNVDKSIVNSLNETISTYDAILKTKNEALNVVLSEKWIYCKKHKISLSVIVDSDTLNFIDKTDIYSLLGNALDNAIEASLNLPYEQRAISFVLKNTFGCISLQIRNNFNGDLKFDEDGELVSIKKDPNGHGFGVKSMKKIAEKYFGTVSFKKEDEIFVLQILIPIASTD